MDDRREPLKTLAASLLILCLCLGVYGATCCRTVSPVGDAGELTTAAVTLGIPHPPGYPLFVLLGHLVSLPPVGDPGFRVNLVAAGAGSVAVVLAFWAMLELGLSRWAAATGALALAFSQTTWEMTASAEVRTLYLATSAALFWLLFRFWRRPTHATLVGMWFLSGLGVAAHYNTMLVAGIVLLGAAATPEGRARWAPLWHLPVALVVGLLPFAYLPLRAQADPYLNWGNPSNLEGLGSVLVRLRYGGLTSVAAHGATSGATEALHHLANACWSEMSPVLLGLALVGLAAAWRRQKRNCVLLLMAVVLLGPVYLVVVQPLPDPAFWPILERQFLAFWLVLAFCVAEGAEWLYTLGQRVGVGSLVVALVLFPAVAHYRGADLHAEPLGACYGRDLLTNLAPQAVLLVSTDPALSTTLYQQGVLNVRPDVIIVPIGLLGSTWFQQQLARRHPQDFAGFDWSKASPEALVTWLLKKGPVYVDNPWGSIDDRIMEEGVVYQIAATPDDIARHDPQPYIRLLREQVLQWNGHEGQQDGLGSNAAYIRFIVGQYSLAYTNLGVAMGRRGWDQQAAQAFDEALVLDPHSALAHFNRGFLFYSHEDYAKAAQQYQAAIQDNPQYVAAYQALSEVYRHTGQTSDADAVLEQARKLVPPPSPEPDKTAPRTAPD